jgi:hypothetical protein
MASRKQRWLAAVKNYAVGELEDSITCDISARKFWCNASGDTVTAPRSAPFAMEQRTRHGVFLG